MKKISLQTKLQDCHVHQRYINNIIIGSKKTIGDLIYSQKYELRRIRGVGKKCIQEWDNFLKVYGLHIGMSEYEIYQYESEETSNCTSEENSNCRTESSVDWEQRRYEITKHILLQSVTLASPKGSAENAVKFADALIEKLKGSEK